MTLAKAKGARGRADRAFSKLVRSRGSCERCGGTQNLQTSHVRSRRYSATRTDLANAQCLCATCHQFFTHHPVEFTEWIYASIGYGEYERLRAKSLAGGKFGKAFWEAEARRLEGLVKKLEEAA